MLPKLPTIYIGYDPREHRYAEVLKASIESKTTDQYNIVPIVQSEVRRAGLYWRGTVDGKNIDQFDGKPFSTQFSFTRFLVPFLNQFSGLALFLDADMYVRTDITELFDTFNKNHPIACVKHVYAPTETIKMDDQVQTVYPRKNWSSLVMWNCDHPDHKWLTVGDVNTKNGSWLHGFQWLEGSIQGYDERWNWLDGHSSAEINPSLVHFTTGGPFWPHWKPKRFIDGTYAEEWKELEKHVINW